MKERFDICVDVILKNEGGYSNYQNDPGGETKFGISKRAFPELDIANLALEEAKEIYFEKYWQPLNLEGIEDINSALQIFDFAVNAGLYRAVKTAQRLCGSYVDGKIGPDTTAKINNLGKCFLSRYTHARKEYYCYLADRNPDLKKFLCGWLKRVDETKIITV